MNLERKHRREQELQNVRKMSSPRGPEPEQQKFKADQGQGALGTINVSSLSGSRKEFDARELQEQAPQGSRTRISKTI